MTEPWPSRRAGRQRGSARTALRDIKEPVAHGTGMDALNTTDFAALLDVAPSDIEQGCGELIQGFDFRYATVTDKAFRSTVLSVLKAIDGVALSRSGPGRKGDWERGWGETLERFIASGCSLDALVPPYIAKHPVSRLFGNYIRPASTRFELDFYTIYRHWLFRTWLRDFPRIDEFGCGTGYNLAIMARLFPDKELTGLDWAESSIRLVQAIAQAHAPRLTGRRFDYFHPDEDLEMGPDTALITLNSMEQLGDDFHPFLDFVLEKRPGLCINSEPLLELYDPGDLLDYLAIRYHEKRNYLRGFQPALRKLRDEGRIAILKEQRVRLGSLFHEGYSIIIWRPL